MQEPKYFLFSFPDKIFPYNPSTTTNKRKGERTKWNWISPANKNHRKENDLNIG